MGFELTFDALDNRKNIDTWNQKSVAKVTRNTTPMAIRFELNSKLLFFFLFILSNYRKITKFIACRNWKYLSRDFHAFLGWNYNKQILYLHKNAGIILYGIHIRCILHARNHIIKSLWNINELLRLCWKFIASNVLRVLFKPLDSICWTIRLHTSWPTERTFFDRFFSILSQQPS